MPNPCFAAGTAAGMLTGVLLMAMRASVCCVLFRVCWSRFVWALSNVKCPASQMHSCQSAAIAQIALTGSCFGSMLSPGQSLL